MPPAGTLWARPSDASRSNSSSAKLFSLQVGATAAAFGCSIAVHRKRQGGVRQNRSTQTPPTAVRSQGKSSADTEVLPIEVQLSQALSEPVLGEEDDPEGEDDGAFCVPRKPIYVVSDSTGESAERAVNKALTQFTHCFGDGSCPVDIIIYKFVNSQDVMVQIVEEAAQVNAMIIFTLVEPDMLNAMQSMCNERGVRFFDMWSPLLHTLGGFLDAEPQGRPGIRQSADSRHLIMIECIEFAREADDGTDPKRWHEADVLLVGPSRAGKTPLAMYLAQRGYKVANYPLVYDEDPPSELWKVDQSKIFALNIEPEKLAKVRQMRAKAFKMGSRSEYSAVEGIRRELRWCNDIYRKNKWLVLDTTYAGVEENSSEIMRVLTARRGGPLKNAVTEHFGDISPSCV